MIEANWMSSNRTIIPGSALPGPVAAHSAGSPGNLRNLTASIVLRRPPGGARPSGNTREDLEQALSASPSDIHAVTRFAHNSSFSILEVSAVRRTIRVAGTVGQFAAAFEATIYTAIASACETYVTYEGSLTVPANLDGIVVAVLGLDQRPAARSR